MDQKTRINLSARIGLNDMQRLGGPEQAESERLASLEASVAERVPRITPPQAFEGRPGYQPGFIEGFDVPLPSLFGIQARDVLKIPDYNDRLDYQHFSIVMSRSRRMAMFVACNIDGSRSKKIPRGDDIWSYDGRIPIEAQIGEELYQRNALDRGHLVRREDPNWGDDSTAEIANEDTFHFTNCTPQMAAFNQKTWLGLENYVLENARLWKDSVHVFTGPVFSATDRIYRDIALPTAFWKVLAFVHDDGRPSATAYMIDQANELRGLGPEAAYGRYRTFQRSIRHIEEITGIGFHALQDFDGFSNEETRTGARIEVPLRSLADVRV